MMMLVRMHTLLLLLFPGVCVFVWYVLMSCGWSYCPAVLLLHIIIIVVLMMVKVMVVMITASFIIIITTYNFICSLHKRADKVNILSPTVVILALCLCLSPTSPLHPLYQPSQSRQVLHTPDPGSAWGSCLLKGHFSTSNVQLLSLVNSYWTEYDLSCLLVLPPVATI